MPFFSLAWLKDAPAFLSNDVLDASRFLKGEETLCERFPRVWPHRSAVAAPTPSTSSPANSHPSGLSPLVVPPAQSQPRAVVAAPTPSTSSPAQSHPSRLSPLVLPPASRTPSSSSGMPSPASGVAPSQPSAGPVGPGVESVPRRGRSLARSTYRRPVVSVAKAITATSPDAVSAAPPAGSSTQPARASKKRPFAEVEMEPRPEGWKSCKRCSSRKQRCGPLKGTPKPFKYPCALCQLDEVECLPQSAVPSESFVLSIFRA